MTRIEAEQIPNCYFLGEKQAKLRIYRNRKISPDPTGLRKYIALPSGWELLKEYSCPIIDGTLNVPSLELEPTGTDANGLPTMLYMDVVVDERGAERCSMLHLCSLMKGLEKVIEGYDAAGARKPIRLAKVRFEKTNEFVSFARADGRTRYKPKPGVRLEFVREVVCVKQVDSITLPRSNLGFEPDANGNPSVIYVLLEKQNGDKSAYLGTMHFEIDELDSTRGQMFLYNDLGPRQIMLEKDPIPGCGYLGKSAVLRIYRSKNFSADPARQGKYISEEGSDEHLEDIPCSIKDETLYIPVFPLEVDTDEQGKPTAVFTAMLVDEKGLERGALFSDAAFEAAGTKESPLTLEMANVPNAKRNPLKVYRSRRFHPYLSTESKWAYAPKSGSLEYVMDVSYEIKDGALTIGEWTIDVDDDEINQDESLTPSAIYQGVIIEGGVEITAFTGYIAGVPPRFIVCESEQSKVIVKLFKRSPFRTRDS